MNQLKQNEAIIVWLSYQVLGEYNTITFSKRKKKNTGLIYANIYIYIYDNDNEPSNTKKKMVLVVIDVVAVVMFCSVYRFALKPFDANKLLMTTFSFHFSFFPPSLFLY